METAYYNLAGGINLSLTKTELGVDTKKIYWTDSENIEIFQNRGITRQKGNTIFLEIGEKITGMAEFSAYDVKKLVITTISGKIYIYDSKTSIMKLLDKTLKGENPVFQNFLNGILLMSEKDELFYIKTMMNTKLSTVN